MTAAKKYNNLVAGNFHAEFRLKLKQLRFIRAMQKANGKLDFFRASWVADYPDAENYLSLFYSKNFAPKGPNYTHFADKEFDVLYESALGETNKNKIEIIYKKMDSLIISKSIIVPLFYDEVIRFTRKNLNGMQINATNLLDLRYVKKLSNSL